MQILTRAILSVLAGTIITACASASTPSVVVFLTTQSPNPIYHPLRASDVVTNPAAYSAIAITTEKTYLSPQWNMVLAPLEITCSHADNDSDWTYLRTQGGLGTVDANMEVRVLPTTESAMQATPDITVITDDGYAGEMCTRDLRLKAE